MYNINFKNLKKGISNGMIFLLAGLFFFLIIGYITFSGMIKKQMLDEVVEAYKIDDNCHLDSDGNNMCSPIYYYKVNNIDYQCKLSYSSSSKVNVNQKNVYYDSSNPNNCVTDYTAKPQFFMYLIMLFPLIFVFVGAVQIIKVIKKIKKVQYLAQNGTLIQNLSYKMEETGHGRNNRQILAPAVDYMMPSGSSIHLVGDPRFDNKQYDEDGFVDLLIDPNDLDNYYIDFKIEKKM